MAERFLVLTPGQAGAEFTTFDDAQAIASQGVAKDRSKRLIVKVVGEVCERREPNVEVMRFDATDAGHVQS